MTNDPLRAVAGPLGPFEAAGGEEERRRKRRMGRMGCCCCFLRWWEGRALQSMGTTMRRGGHLATAVGWGKSARDDRRRPAAMFPMGRRWLRRSSSR